MFQYAMKGEIIMRKVVDLKKQSKKAQKAFYAAQRGSWNGVNPITRVVPNGKAYSRVKAKAEARRDACRPFFAHFFKPLTLPIPKNGVSTAHSKKWVSSYLHTIPISHDLGNEQKERS